MDAKYLIDRPRPGAENMALDQHMLELAVQHESIYLRVYQWSAPTVSLGYFQKYSELLANDALRSLAAVRRATGGGAIVHHYDWTYAIAIPDRVWHDALGANQAVYELVHDQIVRMLVQMGVPAVKWQSTANVDSSSAASIASENGGQACGAAVDDVAAGRADTRADCQSVCPFLCFLRRSPGDIVHGSAKLMGSAQRRIRGGLLQHGSLLLRRSPFARELAGVWDLRPGRHTGHAAGDLRRGGCDSPPTESAWERWAASIGPAMVQAICTGTARALNVNWQPLNDPLPCSPELVQRFESACWNEKR
ncbi:MAG: lipoate--protein ligase family protein [Planctomycetota bacterium]|nr:MAG: lipoate--protein ligase family protein [Planctomycetota bacterium]